MKHLAGNKEGRILSGLPFLSLYLGISYNIYTEICRIIAWLRDEYYIVVGMLVNMYHIYIGIPRSVME